MTRSSGILLPVSALPGPCGIGDLGTAAREFIDFLAAAGQRYWQILPLNPPDSAHSPYLSASTFAGSTDLLSPEPFMARGALTLDEVRSVDWGGDPMRVDYGRVHAGKTALWAAAFAREQTAVTPALRTALAAEPWLMDYCLYMAIKEAQGDAPWYAWPQPLRDRDPAALAEAATQLDARVLLHAYLQTEFTRQWDAVRAYAHAHGVRIIGDLPMYVAADSADVWAKPGQFCLDPDGQPSAVAGVPPDYFCADGQLWGNPLYAWDVMKADGFRWWKDRVRGAAKRYDVVRIDHFRAISSYWVVPRGELTARGGHWAPGPGPALLQALHAAAPELELIAEDLGVIDDDVRRLVARSGCPGMRVLLFGFDPGGTSEHRPDRVRAQRLLCRHARQRARRCVGGARRRGRRLCHALSRRVRCGASARGAAARRYGLARGAVHRADAGRARSRRGEPHEHPRHGRRQLGLAAATRSGGRTGGCTPACTHTGGLPHLTEKKQKSSGHRFSGVRCFFPARQTTTARTCSMSVV